MSEKREKRNQGWRGEDSGGSRKNNVKRGRKHVDTIEGHFRGKRGCRMQPTALLLFHVIGFVYLRLSVLAMIASRLRGWMDAECSRLYILCRYSLRCMLWAQGWHDGINSSQQQVRQSCSHQCHHTWLADSLSLSL